MALSRPVWHGRTFREQIVGPAYPFVISNLCQLSFASATFDHNAGVFLAAQLVESNATYTVDFVSINGERLNSISGTTADAIMKVHWDLIDEHGALCTNEEFNTVLHLTLPDSGRLQTLKGP